MSNLPEGIFMNAGANQPDENKEVTQEEVKEESKSVKEEKEERKVVSKTVEEQKESPSKENEPVAPKKSAKAPYFRIDALGILCVFFMYLPLLNLISPFYWLSRRGSWIMFLLTLFMAVIIDVMILYVLRWAYDLSYWDIRYIYDYIHKLIVLPPLK